MFKIRAILITIIATLFGIGCFLWVRDTNLGLATGNGLRELLLFFDGLLMMSATIVLILASLRIDISSDGKIILPSGNFWNRLMTSMWSDIKSDELSSMSLCGVYWLTVLTLIYYSVFVVMVLFGLGAIIALGYGIFTEISPAIARTNISWVDIREALIGVGLFLKMLLYWFGPIFLPAILLALILSRLERYGMISERNYKLAEATLMALLFGASFASFKVIAPKTQTLEIDVTATKVLLCYLYSALFWLGFAGIMFVAIAILLPLIIAPICKGIVTALCNICAAIFTKCGALRETSFGQLVIKAKKSACPIFVQLPVDNKETH